MKTPKTKLEDLPLFSALPAQSRNFLLRNSLLHTVAAGTVLFEQGDKPNFQHLVVSGSVHLLGRSSTGHEVLIEAVEPPDLLVPATVVTDAPHLLRARVPESSKLLLIQADAFREVVIGQPQLAMQVIGNLAGQFRRLIRQVKNLKLRTAVERVGCYLIGLSVRQKTPGSVTLPYEKGLIASELGMTPESFSRALAALQQEGIEVRGERITIRDVRHLAAVAGVDPLIDDQEGMLRIKPPAAKKAPATKSTAGKSASRKRSSRVPA